MQFQSSRYRTIHERRCSNHRIKAHINYIKERQTWLWVFKFLLRSFSEVIQNLDLFLDFHQCYFSQPALNLYCPDYTPKYFCFFESIYFFKANKQTNKIRYLSFSSERCPLRVLFGKHNISCYQNSSPLLHMQHS